MKLTMNVVGIVLVMFLSQCGRHEDSAAKSLRSNLGALEYGASFRLDTVYKRSFDSVYIYGPYSAVERPSYASKRVKERINSSLRINDNFSALLFVKNGKVAGYCIMDALPVDFAELSTKRGTDEPLPADAKFTVSRSQWGGSGKHIMLYE